MADRAASVGSFILRGLVAIYSPRLSPTGSPAQTLLRSPRQPNLRNTPHHSGVMPAHGSGRRILTVCPCERNSIANTFLIMINDNAPLDLGLAGSGHTPYAPE
jgi:hypothetical protein